MGNRLTDREERRENEDEREGTRLTSMNAEYPIVNHHTQRQEVEHIREVLPDCWRAVFPLAFRVETVSLSRAEGVGKRGQLRALVPQLLGLEKRQR